MYLKKLLVKINQGPNFSKAEVSKYSKCRLRDFKDKAIMQVVIYC